MLLHLKKGITYGPVNSRRLGLSLGINLMPPSVKVCSFDCVYCQYGWTKEREIRDEHRALIPGVEDVARAVETALTALPSAPAYITFSGNGEPSLHPDFPDIVEAVKATRDRLAPGARTAILSNSSAAAEERILKALAGLDTRIMKLDCGTEGLFQRYSRPAAGITLEGVTNGLAELSCLAPVTIQALWSGGTGGNLSASPERGELGHHPSITHQGTQYSVPDPSRNREGILFPQTGSAELDAWTARLKLIRPVFVQVYSLDRDTPAKNLRSLSYDELEVIAARLLADGIPAAAFVRCLRR